MAVIVRENIWVVHRRVVVWLIFVVADLDLGLSNSFPQFGRRASASVAILAIEKLDELFDTISGC